MRPLALSVLYLRKLSPKASPKAISGRTSYLRVRLAFHPYPHVIRRLFNAGRFGPPHNFTYASPCTWVDHPVSGLRQRTIALFRLAFAAAPALRFNLARYRNSPVRSTKSTRSASYGPPTACRHTVSGSFSLPSRGAFHLSLTVLVRYRSLRVFSLGRWSSRIPAGFLVSRGTWVLFGLAVPFRLQGCYLLWRGVPARFD